MQLRSTIVLPALVALTLSACSGSQSDGAFHKATSFGEIDAIVTAADARLVTSRLVTKDPESGRIVPNRIVCAEPSPDLAKAVQSSFGLGAEASVQTPEGISGSAALSIAAARAEAAAQLGERLATIQLLRDGLYRACEAFANGALDKIAYAVMLSRYDDTMISMLMGELAAGAFGRGLATLGGGASSGSVPQADINAALLAADEAKTAADGSRQEVTAAEKNLANKEKDLLKAKEADGVSSQEEAAVADAERDLDKKKGAALSSAYAYAEATAGATATMITARSNAQHDKIAGTLHEMQRTFIENINADALIVACIVALNDRSETISAFARLCAGNETSDGLLVKIVNAQNDAVKMRLERADLHYAVGVISNSWGDLSKLLDVEKIPGVQSTGPVHVVVPKAKKN